MKLQAILFSLLITTAGCFNQKQTNLISETEVDEVRKIIDCFEHTDPPLTNCDNQLGGRSFCEPRQKSTFQIEDYSKLYIPQFCGNIGDVIIFENKYGEGLNFEITSKSFYETSSGYNTGKLCPEDSLKYVPLCLNNELISVSIECMTKDLGFTLNVSTKYDMPRLFISNKYPVTYDSELDFVDIRVFDEFSIYMSDNGNFQNFSVRINNRTSVPRQGKYQQFFSSKKFNDKSYSNVYSKKVIEPTGLNYKFFINDEFGFFAFGDSENILWTIVH